MSKILFVSKDNGGAAMTVPLAKEALANGCEIFPITEHLATKRFEEAGLKAYFSTSADFSQEPFYLDVHKCLLDIKPDAVVVSSGHPIHLEQLFAVFASEMEIPLVCIEDYWSVSRRIKPARPSMVLTIDSYGEEIVERLFGFGARSAVDIERLRLSVGHHEVGAILDAINDQNGLKIFSEKTKDFDFVVTLIGGGEQTTSQLTIILECMRQSRGRWCLVPRFHPKTLKWPDKQGRILGEVWNEMLRPFSDRVVYVPEVKTETVVVGADIVASGFSTLMTGSAYIGRPTICLKTKETMDDLLSQSGGILTEVPAVALQCANDVSEPTDLSKFLGRVYPRAVQEFQPYDPKRAFAALSRFLK